MTIQSPGEKNTFILPKPFIVTIDGGARTGTSSTATLLAETLHCSFLDSGAIYRSITVECLHRGIDPQEHEKVAECARSCDVTFIRLPEGQRVVVNGNDVTTEIRTDRISKIVPIIAQIPEVRERAHAIQHTVGDQLVAEGRDMGTTVFPHANIKFFLIASLEERARRHRTYLIRQSGSEEGVPSLDVIEKDLDVRDRADETRAIDPLRPAEDALIIDTTSLSIPQTVDRMIEEIMLRAKS